MTAKKRENTLSRIICIIINILTNEREIKKRCSLSLLLTPLQKDEKKSFFFGRKCQAADRSHSYFELFSPSLLPRNHHPSVFSPVEV